MKIILPALYLVVAALLSHSYAASGQELVIAENGRSAFNIVRSDGASPSTKYAAAELQKFLKQITGVELPIVSDREPLRAHEVIVGDNAHLRQLGIQVDFEKLGPEGFVIRTVGPHLVIAGGALRGTMYGVYTFLENYLGCRWYSSQVSRIPRQTELTLGPIDDTQMPVLEYREAYYADAMDPDFARRQKLNGNASGGIHIGFAQSDKKDGEKHGGWGLWVHTFFTLVPPSQYFEQHPEYFSLVNGQRVRNKQLCLTNPDVFKISVAELKRRMREQPEDQYWCVSQMDTVGNCQCPACRAIDEREGTPMGSLLEFINKLADEFPDKSIATLAYAYTQRPPKTLRPAKNVAIVLCTTVRGGSRALATDPSPWSASFRAYLEKWAKICDNLVIYQYVVQFTNLVSPFPNLRVLQPNVQYSVENNAKGLFLQGNRELGGEFAELRAYLLAKLMWNPYCDIDEVMDDFLQGYYGAAGTPIRKYIDLMHDALETSGKQLSTFGHPRNHLIGSTLGNAGYLCPPIIEEYDRLFNKAERLVADDEEILLRVQIARMPLMYAKLELRHDDVATRTKIAEKLFDLAKRSGLLRFTEGDLPPERYKAQIMEALANEKRDSTAK